MPILLQVWASLEESLQKIVEGKRVHVATQLVALEARSHQVDAVWPTVTTGDEVVASDCVSKNDHNTAMSLHAMAAVATAMVLCFR